MKEKLSYSNDNLVIKKADGKIKYQISCYRIFLILIVGDVSITTGLLRRIRKYGISICFMTMGFRLYSVIGVRMEGNTLLRKKQYEYHGIDIAAHITKNKIMNQRYALTKMRSKYENIKEGIEILKTYEYRLDHEALNLKNIMGLEGMAAKVYFPRIFDNVRWKGRHPRIKTDYVNALLDIGYTLLFHFVDAVLQCFGFDTYYGVLHKCFYMRKSLVCDIVEPFRPIIDWQIRKSINLNQFKEADFKVYHNQYHLEYKKSVEYMRVLFEAVLQYKDQIFLYIRAYYRAFMKGKEAKDFPIFEIKNDNN